MCDRSKQWCSADWCVLLAQPYSVNKAMGLLLQEASRTSPELHTQIGMWGASVGIDGERHVCADLTVLISHAVARYSLRARG